MITRDIPEDTDNVYREMVTLDLVEDLRFHLRRGWQPPVDLIATLEARGENVNALTVDIERGK